MVLTGLCKTVKIILKVYEVLSFASAWLWSLKEDSDPEVLRF